MQKVRIKTRSWLVSRSSHDPSFLFLTMAVSAQDMHQSASASGYSDVTSHKNQYSSSTLSPTGTITGLPHTMLPTLPPAPSNEPKRNWVPVPDAPWVDPKAPHPSARPRTLVLCFDGTGDQFDDDVCWRQIFCCNCCLCILVLL